MFKKLTKKFLSLVTPYQYPTWADIATKSRVEDSSQLSPAQRSALLEKIKNSNQNVYFYTAMREYDDPKISRAVGEQKAWFYFYEEYTKCIVVSLYVSLDASQQFSEPTGEWLIYDISQELHNGVSDNAQDWLYHGLIKDLSKATCVKETLEFGELSVRRFYSTEDITDNIAAYLKIVKNPILSFQDIRDKTGATADKSEFLHLIEAIGNKKDSKIDHLQLSTLMEKASLSRRLKIHAQQEHKDAKVWKI